MIFFILLLNEHCVLSFMLKEKSVLHMQLEYNCFFSNPVLCLNTLKLHLLRINSALLTFLIIFKVLTCFSAKKRSTGDTGMHLNQINFFLHSLWLQFLPQCVAIKSFRQMLQCLLYLDHACQYVLFICFLKTM